MQKYADPLGIERIIAEQRAYLDATQPTQDQFDDWSAHPITQRLKKILALELYQRNQELAIPHNPDLIIAINQILQYGIAEGAEDDHKH